MVEFKSCRDFDRFEQAVIRRTRYLYDPEHKEFLESLRSTAKNHVRILEQGKRLWRAQLGSDHWNLQGHYVPHKPKRMIPDSEHAVDSRANPKGIPCLYVATDDITAISEVRPWVGAEVSVGLFRTCRRLTVVDCILEREVIPDYLEDVPPEKLEEAIWAHVSNAFSRPVARDDDHTDYVPTQIIAELFRKCRFDGIAYSSMVSETAKKGGYNIALFDLTDAKLVRRYMYQVTNVTVVSHKMHQYKGLHRT